MNRAVICGVTYGLLCRRHPDKNKDPKAEDMFIKISKSYEVGEDASQLISFSNSDSLQLTPVRGPVFSTSLTQLCFPLRVSIPVSFLNTGITRPIHSRLSFCLAHRSCPTRSEGPTLTAMGRWMKTSPSARRSITVSATSTTVSTSMSLFSTSPGNWFLVQCYLITCVVVAVIQLG